MRHTHCRSCYQNTTATAPVLLVCSKTYLYKQALRKIKLLLKRQYVRRYWLVRLVERSWGIVRLVTFRIHIHQDFGEKAIQKELPPEASKEKLRQSCHVLSFQSGSAVFKLCSAVCTIFWWRKEGLEGLLSLLFFRCFRHACCRSLARKSALS
jgi:hypothetical protein